MKCLSLFRLIFVIVLLTPSPILAALGDYDGDGVPDENDLCPLSTDLTGSIPTETLCEGCLGDGTTVQGCNASDILVCKPGPNHHERKVGVSQGAVEKFVSQSAWVRNCVFDPPPPPPPPEISGTASDDNDLVLELVGGNFTLPAGTLPAGTPITFSFEDASALDPGALAEGESAVTRLYHLAFSVLEFVDQPMIVELDVPGQISGGIYLLMKITEGLGKDVPAIPQWNLVIGSHDAAAGKYRFSLPGTAEMFSFVVVEGSVTQGQAALFEPLRQLSSADWREQLFDFTMGLLGIGVAKAEFEIGADLLSRGWLILCNPKKFPVAERPDCEDMVKPLEWAQRVESAAQTLAGKQFPTAALQVATLDQIIKTGYPYVIHDPKGASNVSQEYFILQFLPAPIPPAKNSGEYEFGVLRFYNGAVPETAIHELFHAVTADEVVEVWKFLWIVEGLAAAVEPWMPGSTLQTGPNYLYDGVSWRDWAKPVKFGLKDDNDDSEYTVAELWHTIDGSLAYIEPFFANLDFVFSDGTGMTDHNTYALVGESLIVAGGDLLSVAYEREIENTANQRSYPHCADAVFVLCDGGNCSLAGEVDMPTEELTSLCVPVELLDNVPPSCPDPGWEMEFIGDPVAHRFFVNGTKYKPGDRAPAIDSFKLITSIVEHLAPPVTDPDIVLTREPCPPDYLLQLSQQLTARVDTTSLWGDNLAGYPRNERIVRRFESFEDGSQGSGITFYQVLNAILLEDSFDPQPPLGLESWDAMVQGSAGMAYGGHDYIVNASSTVASNTDGNSASLVTALNTSTSADSNVEIYNHRFGIGASASAGGNYRYATRDASAELTLTWDCNLSSVRVKVIDPAPSNTENTLLSVSRSQGNWVCGSETWTVDANKQIEVSISSVFNVDRFALEGGYGGDAQASGGSATIELRANEP